MDINTSNNHNNNTYNCNETTNVNNTNNNHNSMECQYLPPPPPPPSPPLLPLAAPLRGERRRSQLQGAVRQPLGGGGRVIHHVLAAAWRLGVPFFSSQLC